MNWALVDSNNIVQNIIVYDGESIYIPQAGFTLQQVNSWINIGQNINTSQPTSNS